MIARVAACQGARKFTRFGAKMDAKIPMISQERAYTSPMWYTPEKRRFREPADLEEP